MNSVHVDVDNPGATFFYCYTIKHSKVKINNTCTVSTDESGLNVCPWLCSVSSASLLLCTYALLSGHVQRKDVQIISLNHQANWVWPVPTLLWALHFPSFISDWFRLCGWQCFARRFTWQFTRHNNKVAGPRTRLGLCISCEKTKAILVASEQSPPVTIGQQSIEYVDNFPCLGSYISRIDYAEVDTRARLGKAASVLQGLHQIWNSNTVSTTSKLRLYKSMVIQVAIYVADTWKGTTRISHYVGHFPP